MEELIEEIHKRNILWNKKNPRYKDRLAVDKEWDTVAERTGFTKVEAKKKWRNLRDQFSKEMKKNPKPRLGNPQDGFVQYTGKWQYFSSLMFLKDIVTPRNTVLFKYSHDSTAENCVSEAENSEETTICSAAASSQAITHDIPQKIASDAAHFESNPPKAKQSRRKRKRETNADMKEQLAKKLAALEGPEDENSLFLRSLLPYMQRMDPLQQLRVRSKFQKILIQEMCLARYSSFPFFNTYCPASPSSATPSLQSSNYSSVISPRSPTESS